MRFFQLLWYKISVLFFLMCENCGFSKGIRSFRTLEKSFSSKKSVFLQTSLSTVVLLLALVFLLIRIGMKFLSINLRQRIASLLKHDHRWILFVKYRSAARCEESGHRFSKVLNSEPNAPQKWTTAYQTPLLSGSHIASLVKNWKTKNSFKYVKYCSQELERTENIELLKLVRATFEIQAQDQD